MTIRHPNHRDPDTLPVELRRAPVPAGTRAWAARQVGSEVVRVRRLSGASSTAVHGLTFADASRLVLRRYVWPGFLRSEPDAPRREVDVLAYAHAHGLRVPALVASDVDGAEQPDGVPAILMSFLPGTAIAVPDLRALAEAAAAIHAVDGVELGHRYFPWYLDTTRRPPRASTRPALWQRALTVWHEEMPAYAPTFIHRDFHPGNVLWVRGRLGGVVDWPNGCRGPIGCDLAHCYDNLLSLSGSETADAFIGTYESLTGFEFDPFWEVASILEHDGWRFTPEQLAVDEPRLERALAQLGRA